MSSVKNIDTYIDTLDTYIDVMKEEAARLSGMIESLNNKIKETEAEKEQLIKEQNEPRFERLSHGEPYYYIYGNNMKVAVASDDSDYTSAVCYMHNNYFHTKKRAQEVADKIKLLLKLERLHDIYCPDYKPDDWGTDSLKKYYVCYSPSKAKWRPYNARTIEDAFQVYFPTGEITQKICDILNKEE